MQRSTSSGLGLIALAVLLAPLSAQQSLTTMFLAGNSLNAPAAQLFDVTVLNPYGIVITSLDVNCENTRNGPVNTLFDLRVYITARGGTFLGNELNPTAWTLAASGQGTSQPQNSPTPVDVSDFYLPAGTFGVAVFYANTPGGGPLNGTAIAYTNGTGTNQQFANADLQLNLGCAVFGFFVGPIYTPRVWNGTVHYEAGTRAAYGTYGTGCSGGSPNGAPVLAPGATNPLPRIGGPFNLQVNNLGTQPYVGILVFGMSFQTWGPWTLPMDLGLFGMPACNTHIPPDATLFVVHTGGGSITIPLGIPNNQSLTSLILGTQVLMLDPQATNSLRGNITNLAAGRVGT